MERVLPHVWTRVAGADALVRLLPLRDAVQRRAAGDANVQQHGFLSGGTRDHGFRYVKCPQARKLDASFCSFQEQIECFRFVPLEDNDCRGSIGSAEGVMMSNLCLIHLCLTANEEAVSEASSRRKCEIRKSVTGPPTKIMILNRVSLV